MSLSLGAPSTSRAATPADAGEDRAPLHPLPYPIVDPICAAALRAIATAERDCGAAVAARFDVPRARSLRQGRESRLWCMLVCELLDAGETLERAAHSARLLVVDEESPAAVDDPSFVRDLRDAARGCATPRDLPRRRKTAGKRR